MSWKAGDVAILSSNAHVAEIDHAAITARGQSCTLIKYEGLTHHAGNVGTIHNCWQVDVGGMPIWADESVLRKPYDGHSKCSWESMKDIWTPDVIATPILERI